MTEVVRRWASNSAMNVIGGLSAAAFNLLVPGIISRHLPADQFAVWSLSLQIVAYVNLLGLGLQTAAARFIAQAHERQDSRRLQQTVRACQTISRFTAGLGLLLALILALVYPQAFPDLPPGLVGDFQWAVFFVGASSALQLLAMVPMGVYQGLHSNRSFVSIQILVRALTLILIAIGTRAGCGLLALTTLFSLGNLLLPLLLALRLTRQFDWVRGLASVKLDRALLRDLLSYCGTLSVWSISMLLVNSVGTLVVGRIAFHMTGAYSIALVAATVLAGLLGALLAPLLTTAAAMHAQDSQRAGLPVLLKPRNGVLQSAAARPLPLHPALSWLGSTALGGRQLRCPGWRSAADPGWRPLSAQYGRTLCPDAAGHRPEPTSPVDRRCRGPGQSTGHFGPRPVAGRDRGRARHARGCRGRHPRQPALECAKDRGIDATSRSFRIQGLCRPGSRLPSPAPGCGLVRRLD